MAYENAQAVSVPEAARRLGVSNGTLKKELRLGNVPYRKLGNRVLVPVVWINEMTGQPEPERQISAAEASAVLQEVASSNAEWQRVLRELGKLPIPR